MEMLKKKQQNHSERHREEVADKKQMKFSNLKEQGENYWKKRTIGEKNVQISIG